MNTKEQVNAKHQKKPGTKHRRTKVNLQSACSIIVHQQVNANKHQGTNKHQTLKETNNKTQQSKSKFAKHRNQVHHH
jgi:hypothetical protein